MLGHPNHLEVEDELAGLAAELGTDRADVCGQRLVELRARELAWEGAAAAVERGEERELASRVAAGLAPLVPAVNRASRRPRSALWRGAGDRLAQALALAGEELGAPQRGERAARLALSQAGPLAGPVRVVELQIAGGTERVLLRNGCCLWHRIPGEPKCSSCPLLDARERASRLLAEREEAG